MCPNQNNCPECNGQQAPVSPERRKAFGWLVGAINAVVGIAIIGPALGFIGAPLMTKLKGRWIAVLEDDELPVGETKEVTFGMKVRDGYQTVDREYTVYVHRSEDSVLAFDPACTHLGCRVEFQKDKGRYFCPCHGGVFGTDGSVVSGPPPKPLDPIQTKLEDGKVWVFKEV